MWGQRNRARRVTEIEGNHGVLGDFPLFFSEVSCILIRSQRQIAKVER